MRFIVIDTETTGFDPGEHRIIEFAAMELKDGSAKELFDFIVDPQRDIPPEASAVHHLTAKHVQGKPTFEEIWPFVLAEITKEPDTALVAHNAEYDSQFIPDVPGVPWVCTYRLAQHFWPHAPNHKNQTLRYWLGLDIETGVPHRAMSDVQVTVEVLKCLLQERVFHSLEEIVQAANAPIIASKMPFGKHRGEEIATQVPTSYIQWAVNNMKDIDFDLRYTLETELKRRIGEQESEGVTDMFWDRPWEDQHAQAAPVKNTSS